MEDYLTFQEFEQLQEEVKAEKEKKNPKLKSDYSGAAKNTLNGLWIILKLIGFGFGKLMKGIYNGLLKLNEGMEKARKSEFGKNLKKYHEQPQAQNPFMMFNPQKKRR